MRSWRIALIVLLVLPLLGAGSKKGRLPSEDEIEAYIFDADADEIVGTWTWADEIAAEFGTDSDWKLYYNEAGFDQLFLSTPNAQTTLDSIPMFEILVDDQTNWGAGVSDSQMIFSVSKGTTVAHLPLLYIRGDGDTVISGALNVGGAITFNGPFDVGVWQSFGVDDVTPDVSTSSLWAVHGNSTPGYTITDFDWGATSPPEGQLLYIVSVVAVTYDCTGAGLKCGDADIATITDDLTTWVYRTPDWYLDNDPTPYLPLAGGTLTGSLTVEDQIIQTFGTRNVIIGDATAGNGGVTTDSVIIGDAAGASMAAGGVENVIIGTNAGTAITTGDNSVLIGYDAGTSLVTAAGTMVGNDAGKLTTGAGNTFVGLRAGPANTTGGSNTFVGEKTGLISTASRNVFIGFETGDTVTTGGDNTIIGVGAGAALEDGTFNVILGAGAGAGIVSGDFNSIFGEAAGSGGDFSNSTFFGNLAGAVSTGANATFVGTRAGVANTSGGNNTAVGYNALEKNTTGGNNTAVGYNALKNLVATATHNTGVGNIANQGSNGSSDHNTAIGSTTLSANGERFRNTAVGYGAGDSITTGDDNILVGHKTGQKITTANANTIVGMGAGFNVTGGSNLFLGYYAGRFQAAVSDRLLIDNQDRANAADELTESLIYGDFAADPANQTLTFNADTAVTYGFSVDIETVTGTSATLGSDDFVMLIDDDTAGSTVTITLPAAASNTGRVYHVKKLGTTANVVVDGNASETIDGATTLTMTIQYESIKLVCDGSNWSII